MSVLPQHGGAKQPGTGLMRKIKKDWGSNDPLPTAPTTAQDGMMYNYPVELTPDDNNTVMATFPDVPEAVTFGDDDADALVRAGDALETALNGYITDRRDVPAPSQAIGRQVVSLSLLATLKLGIYATMRARGWRKADLARALAVNPRQIDRLLDLTHATTVEQLEQAAHVAGGRYIVEIREVVGFGQREVLTTAA